MNAKNHYLLGNSDKCTKKGPVTKTGPEVCSQFGKLTKLLLGSSESRGLIRRHRQRTRPVHVRPRTVHCRRSL